MRLEAVRQGLNRLVDGNPGLFISPRCSVLRKGFAGGYHYRPLRTGTGLQYHESPAKNEYRSEEHTSELQSLLRISYAVFCLKKKNKNKNNTIHHNIGSPDTAQRTHETAI